MFAVGDGVILGRTFVCPACFPLDGIPCSCGHPGRVAGNATRRATKMADARSVTVALRRFSKDQHRDAAKANSAKIRWYEQRHCDAGGNEGTTSS